MQMLVSFGKYYVLYWYFEVLLKEFKLRNFPLVSLMEKYHKTTSLDGAEKNYFFIILTFSVQTDFFQGF